MSTEISQENFAEFTASGVSLIDFWAPWCGPCRMQLPVLDQVARELPDVKIGKINVDENPDLAARFGVNTIPYLIIFKDGAIVQQFIGLRQPRELVDALNAVLA
jgi:thioredoxin 1